MKFSIERFQYKFTSLPKMPKGITMRVKKTNAFSQTVTFYFNSTKMNEEEIHSIIYGIGNLIGIHESQNII